MKLLFLILLSIPLHSEISDFFQVDNKYIYSPSYNSFGQVGIIQLPSAESKPEGTISFTFNKNEIWKFGTLSVSPFDWLEASYFYYRPSDLYWTGPNTRGLYLDKGFNVKFSHEVQRLRKTNIAVGMDDFAGTGLFSKEYIVSTRKFSNNLKATFGLGWGRFSAENNFENPFSRIDERFSFRNPISSNFNKGGSLSYDNWFRGPSSIFGGIEFIIPELKGLNFKIEYDPFSYFGPNSLGSESFYFDRGEDQFLRRKDSNINIGFVYKLNNFLTLNSSYIKGNSFNLSLNFALTFDENLRKKERFQPSIDEKSNTLNKKLSFYEDLLLNLNNNKLFLQTANIDNDNNLSISMTTSQYRNNIQSSSYVASIVSEVSNNNSIDLTTTTVSLLNAGIELNKIKYISNHVENSDTPIEVLKTYTKFMPGDMSYLKHEFKPSVNFPVVFNSISPTIINHIGDPQKFYYGGLAIQNVNEIQFRRNIILNSEIKYIVSDNFQDIVARPDSLMQKVRTDIVQYLRESDMQLTKLHLDYFWSPYKNVFGKASMGLFESMYGGVGFEVMYTPFNKKYWLGTELFYVRQRDFKQDFNFKDYQTTTGHINFGYLLPLNIELKLSYGKYLAKDVGYTFDLSRRTKSGFRAGAYFTQTNVSAEIFGEGSFDKGFYFQIPIDLFSKGYSTNYTSFKLSPLTRDGGAKLDFNNLRGMIFNSTYDELYEQWRGYKN